MSKKNFIRLNINDKYLSLGNYFRIIKEESNNTNAFWQSDLFSIIFNTDSIADSTVNNYCTGMRSINPMYKKYFSDLLSQYEKNKDCFILIICKTLELVYSKSIDSSKYTIKEINNDEKLKRICSRLYSISKNDSDVNDNLLNMLQKNLNSNNLYEFIILVLEYIILTKKQPIYIEDSLRDIIEKSIYDTNISAKSIQEFIDIQLNSGIWSIRKLNELAKKENPFACFEMASMEYNGIISGKPRYEEAYKYYKIAAQNNHPVANWAIGYLYYKGYIGSKSKSDLCTAFKYFNKARKLKCSNAFNSLGLIIKEGCFPHIKPNLNKSIEYFEKSASMGNVYAYNNLGKIYESQKNFKLAFEYYSFSANSGDSWALNKLGEFYRKGIYVSKDLNIAFDYYYQASIAPRFTLCNWSKYNLAKYFYKYGLIEIGIKKDLNKAIELFEDSSCEILESTEELIYIYYDLYLDSNKTNNDYLEKLNFYINKLENNEKYSSSLARKVNEILKDIYEKKEHIKLP